MDERPSKKLSTKINTAVGGNVQDIECNITTYMPILVSVFQLFNGETFPMKIKVEPLETLWSQTRGG